jgi:glycosyltransferase involved in cell wall biosynthesis
MKFLILEMSLDITIVLPVKNEAINLPACLAAIGKEFAQKIVVVDSGSTDQTKDIALDFGAEYLNFEWDGKFPKKRNWYLRNHKPDTTWVLFLDADEYLSPEFKLELKNAIKNTDKVGFWLSYTVYFLGKKLKGGYPLRKLALFRVGTGEYEKIDEAQWSHLDMEVHEHPVLEGEVGVLKSKIDHQDFRGVSHYVLKHNEYSSWEAARFQKMLEEGKSEGGLTWKQKIKYKLLQSSLVGPVYFLGSFFLMGGFLDGSRGLAFAMMKASYFTQIYCKMKE